MLRLRDCLERAVPLLLEATARCGSLCHARAWRNTRVHCSGPRPGLVTVAITGLQLRLVLPLNLSVCGPTSRTRLCHHCHPSLPGVAPGRAGWGPGWPGTAQPCPRSRESTAMARGWVQGGTGRTAGDVTWLSHCSVPVAPVPGLGGLWAVLSYQGSAFAQLCTWCPPQEVLDTDQL